MSSPTIEQVYAALFTVGWNAYAWQNSQSQARRLKLWGEVDTSQKPCFFQFEGGDNSYDWSGNAAQPKRRLTAQWYVYIDAKAPNVIGSQLLNAICDALDTALQITGRDAAVGRFTLGGLVYWCRIDGSVFRDPGDLDGDGMLRVPISILLP